MRRREFITFLGGAAMAWPLAAAQTAGTVRRIGVLANNPPSVPAIAPLWAAFIEGLRERGWVEGQNLSIEARWAAGRTERFSEFAAELVARDVEVIVVLAGSQATQVAQRATSTIPIVFAGISNPIEAGFVASLARPGGNVTGVSNQLGDIVEKWVELLRASVPDLHRLGLIWEPANPGSLQGHKDLEAVAPRLGLSVVSLPIAAPEDLKRVFAMVAEARPQALIVHPSAIVGRVHKEIIAFAIAERLPTITGLSACNYPPLALGRFG